MKITNAYGRLEGVTFELLPTDLFHLLHKAGHIPEGFTMDHAFIAEEWSDDTVLFRVRRYTQEPGTTSEEEPVRG